MTSQSYDIVNLDRLQPVHYLIFHYLKTDHPHTLLPVNKDLHRELVTIVYRPVKLKHGGLFQLLRNLFIDTHDEPLLSGSSIVNCRVQEALALIGHLEIWASKGCEEINGYISRWTDKGRGFLFPKLKHLALGENTIANMFLPAEGEGIYTVRPECAFLFALISTSAVKTLCIDWPETSGEERFSNPDDGGSLID